MSRWRRWRTSILLILAVLGPDFITANVDNDSGGIYTYATAGAQFGYALLWTMIPMAIMLAFAQEISARMGVVTGKGLSELIREEFGLRITAMLMFGLVLCNLGDVVSEFAGVIVDIGCDEAGAKHCENQQNACAPASPAIHRRPSGGWLAAEARPSRCTRS